MNENKECSNCKKLFPKNIMSTPFKDKTKMGKYCNPCYITKKEKNTITNK
jgi:hypothetical protein